MRQSLSLTTMVVADYDEALTWFVEVLGFELREDLVVSDEKRWVVVAPPGSQAGLLLARGVGEDQRKAIGNQTGGRVFLFLETDDFARDHAAFQARGVTFLEEPRFETYGTVAVFADLYGNRWDLLEPAG